MTEAEFKIGEIVTFHGYAKELIKAKVVEVYHTPHTTQTGQRMGVPIDRNLTESAIHHLRKMHRRK